MVFDPKQEYASTEHEKPCHSSWKKIIVKLLNQMRNNQYFSTLVYSLEKIYSSTKCMLNIQLEESELDTELIEANTGW